MNKLFPIPFDLTESIILHLNFSINVEKCSVTGLKKSGFTTIKDEPQYLIKSDKTDHLAMHKGSALRKTLKPKG